MPWNRIDEFSHELRRQYFEYSRNKSLQWRRAGGVIDTATSAEDRPSE